MIPEKGDPTLALQEPGKNSGIPIKNRYASQLESSKQYQSTSAILSQERAREITKSSPYSRHLPEYQRGDFSAINSGTDNRKLTVDPKLAVYDKSVRADYSTRPISNYSMASKSSTHSKSTFNGLNHISPERRAVKALA